MPAISTAVEAANIQFAMSLLTPALRCFIHEKCRRPVDWKEKDFMECCRHILNTYPLDRRYTYYSDEAVKLRNHVSHQGFYPYSHNAYVLRRIATFLERDDLEDLIIDFVMTTKRAFSDEDYDPYYSF